MPATNKHKAKDFEKETGRAKPAKNKHLPMPQQSHQSPLAMGAFFSDESSDEDDFWRAAFKSAFENPKDKAPTPPSSHLSPHAGKPGTPSYDDVESDDYLPDLGAKSSAESSEDEGWEDEAEGKMPKKDTQLRQVPTMDGEALKCWASTATEQQMRDCIRHERDQTRSLFSASVVGRALAYKKSRRILQTAEENEDEKVLDATVRAHFDEQWGRN